MLILSTSSVDKCVITMPRWRTICSTVHDTERSRRRAGRKKGRENKQTRKLEIELNGDCQERTTKNRVSEIPRAKYVFEPFQPTAWLRNQPLRNATYQIVVFAYTTVRLSLRQQIPSRFVLGIVLHFQQFLRAACPVKVRSFGVSFLVGRCRFTIHGKGEKNDKNPFWQDNLFLLCADSLCYLHSCACTCSYVIFVESLIIDQNSSGINVIEFNRNNRNNPRL